MIAFSQVKVEVENYSKIKEIDGRKVEFGVKETVEELLVEKGYQLNDTLGAACYVYIQSIKSPHQILNIMGTKWLKKSYIVDVKIGMGESLFEGTGKRTTFLFAAFLDVENNEVPLNRKAFSKALQSALKDCTNNF